MTLNILLCGFGAFGQQHAAAWAEVVPDHRLLVAELDPELRRLAVKCGSAPDDVSVDYKDLISNADIVDIVTSSDSHYALAMDALSAGKPTLIEKPAVKQIEEADRLEQRAAEHSLPVQVQFVLRVHPLVAEASRLLKQGRIGSLLAMDAVFTGWKRMRPDASILENDGVHMLDLMHFFAKSPAYSFDINGDRLLGGTVPDTIHLRLKYSDKIVGWLRTGITFGGKQADAYLKGSLTTKTFKLIGDEGTIDLDFNSDTMDVAQTSYRPTPGGFTPEIGDLYTKRSVNITPAVLLMRCFEQFLGVLEGKQEVVCDLKQGAVEITKLLVEARTKLES